MVDDIKELTLGELENILEGWHKPSFHARQIFSWLYQKRVGNFEQMSNLPFELRVRLKEKFYLFGLKLLEVLTSEDGTGKFILELKDGNFIEAVIIPAENRTCPKADRRKGGSFTRAEARSEDDGVVTALRRGRTTQPQAEEMTVLPTSGFGTGSRLTGCISSQVGCKFACCFCASGLRGFKRNLNCGEMLDEVLCLERSLGDKKLTHIVFMGVGEPLDNYDNVLRAIKIINSPHAFNIASRRITISTSGIIPGIKRLSDEGLQVELSISLHASDEKTRSLVMPVNRIYPLSALLSVCREYIKKTNRQITFEYILIRGLNSSLQNARRLGIILRDLNCKVNLIPANPVKELKIAPPEKEDVSSFKHALLKSGVHVTLRKPRGKEIQAACGQLRLRYGKK